MTEHKENKEKPETFAGKYYCYKLVYYERHIQVNHAIEREKEIKLMGREAKERLIKQVNPLLLELRISG